MILRKLGSGTPVRYLLAGAALVLPGLIVVGAQASFPKLEVRLQEGRVLRFFFAAGYTNVRSELRVPRLLGLVVANTDLHRVVCEIERKKGAELRRIGEWKYGHQMRGFSQRGCKPLTAGRYFMSVQTEDGVGDASFEIERDGSAHLFEDDEPPEGIWKKRDGGARLLPDAGSSPDAHAGH